MRCTNIHTSGTLKTSIGPSVCEPTSCRVCHTNDDSVSFQPYISYSTPVLNPPSVHPSLATAMSMSTSPIFPVEVCERVISSLWCIHMLWSHYVRTLYNCALVCRAWAPTSRTCLYHTIRFGQGRRGIDENLHQLERTLVAHPHLSRLIREVQVIAPGLVMVPVAPHLQSVLALLSGKVPNLKSLRYRDTPFETHGGFWIHTPRLPLHRSFFINTFAFRTLEHLELSQTTFDSLRELLHILYRCPSLRRLCLDGVEVRRWNSDPIFTKLPPVAHLSVGGKNAIASVRILQLSDG